MRKPHGAIGVFDSGFGGLSILRAIQKKLPAYRYVYFGDTARAPYGNRSPEAVYRFTTQAVDFLFNKGCELVVLACNTASAEALRRIQQEHLRKYHPARKRVLGVIVPTLESIEERRHAKRLGILATEGTVRSGTFPKELKKIAPHARVFQKAAPLLVPLVEAGEHKTKAAELILASYLKPLIAKRIDTLVLACTHYGHLERSIKNIVGPRIAVMNEDGIVSEKLKEYLLRHPEIEARLAKDGATSFYTSDVSSRFDELSRLFYGTSVRAKKAELG